MKKVTNNSNLEFTQMLRASPTRLTNEELLLEFFHRVHGSSSHHHGARIPHYFLIIQPKIQSPPFYFRTLVLYYESAGNEDVNNKEIKCWGVWIQEIQNGRR
jgi:hypothetical protein